MKKKWLSEIIRIKIYTMKCITHTHTHTHIILNEIIWQSSRPCGLSDGAVMAVYAPAAAVSRRLHLGHLLLTPRLTAAFIAPHRQHPLLLPSSSTPLLLLLLLHHPHTHWHTLTPHYTHLCAALSSKVAPVQSASVRKVHLHVWRCVDWLEKVQIIYWWREENRHLTHTFNVFLLIIIFINNVLVGK